MAENAQSDEILVKNVRRAVALELQIKRELNRPIAKFDPKSRTVYLESADGTREVVGEAMKRGRYSERCK